jgi:hypothetical protein
MSELQPYQGAQVPLLRDSRRAARSISRIEAQTQMRLASIDHETDTSIAKVESHTTVVGRGMTAVVQVAQAQKQLETLAPEASGRLAMLADAHALILTEIMASHQQALRRR